jgi:hypothetical protein
LTSGTGDRNTLDGFGHGKPFDSNCSRRK